MSENVNFTLTDEGFFIDGKQMPCTYLKVEAGSKQLTEITATFVSGPNTFDMDVNLERRNDNDGSKSD